MRRVNDRGKVLLGCKLVRARIIVATKLPTILSPINVHYYAIILDNYEYNIIFGANPTYYLLSYLNNDIFLLQ